MSYPLLTLAISLVLSTGTAAATEPVKKTNPLKEAMIYLIQSGELDTYLKERMVLIQKAEQKLKLADRLKLKEKKESQKLAAIKAHIPLGISDDDHLRGTADAAYTIYEYSDFGCPFCSRFHDTMKGVIAQKPEVNWVYRHYPLPMHSPNADKLAIASECFAKLGSNDLFWSFTDFAFQGNQGQKDPGLVIDTFSKTNGMDRNSLDQCLSDPLIKAKVERGIEEAKKSRLTGTPSAILRQNETGEFVFLPGAVSANHIETQIRRLENEIKK